MKVAFIQQELRERFAVMYLSACLKRAGHQTDVFIYSKGEIKDAIKYDADLYAFSSSTPSYPEDLIQAKVIKKKTGKPIIFGGPHATFNPMAVIREKCIDYVCVGEGYEAIVEVASGPHRTDIKNIWRKDIRNDVRPLYDIDLLPMPDYSIYYNKYDLLRMKSTKQVYIVRGCPYACSFCYNPVYNALYPHQKIVQCMNIDKAINEIKELYDTYGFRYLQFISDTMSHDKKWLMRLVRRLKREVGLPYLLNVRANNVDEELVKTLKDTGCNRVDFGVEHGDDDIRNRILKRNMTDDTIIKCGQLFEKYGVKVQTTNIFGLPEETIDRAIKTVKLNQHFKQDITKACILQPFPGTAIRQYAEERGYLQNLDVNTGTTYQIGHDGRGFITKIKLKDEKKLIRLSYLLDFLVKHKWLNPYIKLIVSLPFDRLYRYIQTIPFNLQEKKFL